MVLSSKKVSCDNGLDWNNQTTQLQTQSTLEEQPKQQSVIMRSKHQHQQQQQQQHSSEPLKCPRCESKNTKFCYYNNYNKSQPRHFCKTCKRYWTNGGTLRNVPLGGCRKNKRPGKTSKAAANSASISTASAATTNPINVNCQQAALHQNSINNMGSNRLIDTQESESSLFLPYSSSSNSLDQEHLFSISTSIPSLNVNYNYTVSSREAMEDYSTITTSMPSSSNWNGEDIDALVFSDLSVSWDDYFKIKP